MNKKPDVDNVRKLDHHQPVPHLVRKDSPRINRVIVKDYPSDLNQYSKSVLKSLLYIASTLDKKMKQSAISKKKSEKIWDVQTILKRGQ